MSLNIERLAMQTIVRSDDGSSEEQLYMWDAEREISQAMIRGDKLVKVEICESECCEAADIADVIAMEVTKHSRFRHGEFCGKSVLNQGGKNLTVIEIIVKYVWGLTSKG